MHLQFEPEYNEMLVRQIIAAAAERRLRSMGQFNQLVQPYVTAGYQREVTEAHRRYFEL